MEAASRAARSACALLAGALSLTVLSACHGGADDGLPLRLEISHDLAGQPLKLGQETALPNGEHLSVDHLRYYLSNFRLHRVDGQWSAAAHSDADARGYFLVDESEATSKLFDIAGFDKGEYDGIEFVIGVDAARNSAGVQSGALDPARGMFWTWNTGYIFFKLEGHSPESSARSQIVEYHVGGSREPTPARTVYLPLGVKPVKLDPKLVATVHLQGELGTLFEGEPGLRIADKPTIMDPAAGATVADRYAAMFRVDHIHHEPRRAR